MNTRDSFKCHQNMQSATPNKITMHPCPFIMGFSPTPPHSLRYGGAFWTKMQSNRDLHSIGSYPGSIRSYLSSIRSYFNSIRSYFHSIGSYLSSIRSYFNYFVASYMTLVYSSVVFHIYPYLRGNSIPSDRNYRSAVVTIWSAVKRGRLNLDLVLVWRHTTYDYMTYN